MFGDFFGCYGIKEEISFVDIINNQYRRVKSRMRSFSRSFLQELIEIRILRDFIERNRASIASLNEKITDLKLDFRKFNEEISNVKRRIEYVAEGIEMAEEKFSNIEKDMANELRELHDRIKEHHIFHNKFNMKSQ